MDAGTRTAGVRAYRRTAMVLAASLALTGTTLALAPSGHAAELEPSPAESGEVRNGTAKAIATVAAIAPGVGNLALGMTVGTAVTQVTNSLAQSTSQTGDLGLIGSSLTSESCSGSTTLSPEDLPQPTSVDNRSGDASETATEGGEAGSPVTFGEMHVEATDEPPASTARTTMAAIGQAGAARIGAGEASSASRVLPGEGREAIAEVRTSLALGDVLELRGLRWRAHHRTGVDPFAEGAFEVGGASVGGVPVPVDDLGALEDALNGALAPAGIRLELPRTQRVTDPSDFVRVTPLVIEIRDSPLGKAAVGPLLDLTREQRNQLFDDVVAVACQAASVLLVGDIGISVVGGTGFLTIGLGGVEASSSDLEVGNPFGSFTPGLGVAPPDLGGGLPGPAATPSRPTAPPAVGVPGTVPAAGGTTARKAQPARSLGPIDEVCESLHPNGTSCSEGAASAVGLLGLLATVGIAGADTVRQRRHADLLEA